MENFLRTVERGLRSRRLLQPVLLSSPSERILAKKIASAVPKAQFAPAGAPPLMGRDVIVCHSGETGWDEILEMVCKECPSRLFVVARTCPRAVSLKLEWIADEAFVEHEMYQYEVHELGLSA